ncbi:hypothetical protein FQN54_000274 [Arachnomyces sp. PD_36]|nr:hypothetical protein FQN54_000274 [Arachnomyces sp. PD_36]
MAPADPQALSYDPRIILKMRLVTHTLGPASPTTSDNHWSIFFIISEVEGGKDSVRANMTAPDYEKRTGQLQWENHNYVISNSAVQYWDIPVTTPGLAVSHVVTLFLGMNRQEYDMAAGGSGCRWWCYTALLDLADWGYIGPSEPSRLLPYFGFQYHKTQPPKALTMPMGEFFPRVIPQPPIYRYGNPLQEFLPFALNGQTKWIPLSDWFTYRFGDSSDDDGVNNNNPEYLRNDRYNICFRQLTPFQYAN